MNNFNFEKVGVLMGGQTAEREISLTTGQCALEALIRSGVNAVGIDVGDDIIDQIKSHEIDCAFIALHGRGGEDGKIQALLEFLNIPYSGSGVLASSIAMEKMRCKKMWLGSNLPTPPFVKLEEDFDADEVIEKLGLPFFVKPSREGSSMGITKVNSKNELQAAWLAAFEYDDIVIAEKFIDGAELTVGILEGNALPAIRITTPRDFYDFDAKYLENSTEYIIPSGLSAEQEKECQSMALKAFDAIGCEGWGRVDFMQDADGAFWLIEVNTVPGLTEHSLVPKAASAIGIEFDELVVRILGAKRVSS